LSIDKLSIFKDILKIVDMSKNPTKEEIFRDSSLKRKIFDEQFDKLVGKGFVKRILTPEMEQRKVYKLSESGEHILKILDEEEPLLSLGEDAAKLRRIEFLFSLLRHDLANKLGSIGFYQEFLREMGPPEDFLEPLEKMEKITQTSIDLIEKINTFREVGKEETEEVRIDEVIERALYQTEPLISLKDMKIEKNYSKHVVYGGYLLEDLFSNLIENAIEHSNAEIIRISSIERNDIVTISVEDDGKGISEDEKDKVFEKGYKERKSSGSGLGLYLVKAIAESYKGSVQAGDSNMGGARFDIHLKKAGLNRKC